MRSADPNELQTHAYPVMTAAISEAELTEWFPVRFQHVTDPQEAAEPSRAALVRLDTDECFALIYGELSNQIMLRIPTSVDAAAFMRSFFREVPLPTSRIIWRRQDAQLPRQVAANVVQAPRRKHPIVQDSTRAKPRK